MLSVTLWVNVSLRKDALFLGKKYSPSRRKIAGRKAISHKSRFPDPHNQLATPTNPHNQASDPQNQLPWVGFKVVKNVKKSLKDIAQTPTTSRHELVFTQDIHPHTDMVIIGYIQGCIRGEFGKRVRIEVLQACQKLMNAPLNLSMWNQHRHPRSIYMWLSTNTKLSPVSALAD